MSNLFSFGTLGITATIVLLVLFFFTMLVRQYRRCPSNRVLVVYGKVSGQRAARCLHGGGHDHRLGGRSHDPGALGRLERERGALDLRGRSTPAAA